MKIPFDKVYCISYCRNVQNQKNIRKIMNYLGIDFEFIYGADYSNLCILKDLNFVPDTENYIKTKWQYYTHFIGASYDHYTAILHAYESGANSVLIMEDDCMFINDLKYIEYHLNNYPKDADYVKFGCQRVNYDTLESINNDDLYSNNIYSDDRDIFNTGQYLGCQLYGVCNRELMKRYIDWQQSIIHNCDAFFNMHRDKKLYYLKRPIALDKGICNMLNIANKRNDYQEYNLLENI